MPEFSGLRCDGPECRRKVDLKDPEARSWLRVEIESVDSRYHESVTFDSLQCFDRYIREQIASQQVE